MDEKHIDSTKDCRESIDLMPSNNKCSKCAEKNIKNHLLYILIANNLLPIVKEYEKNNDMTDNTGHVKVLLLLKSMINDLESGNF